MVSQADEMASQASGADLGGAEGARAPPWTHTFHNACTHLVAQLVQELYGEFGINLKQIATQTLSTVSYTEKCTL